MAPARLRAPRPYWTVAVPMLAIVLLVLVWHRPLPGLLIALVVALLVGAVLAAVHHAELIAHRVGQPFGALVLAVAVTLIEVALIVTVMADGGPEAAGLARDTVFAAVMITCNGIVGLSLLVGAVRRRVAVFNAEGTGASLAAVCTVATLSMVLPTFTTSTPGPRFSRAQLIFAAVSALILYALFVATQAVRHRSHFLPITTEGRVVETEEHVHPPTLAQSWTSLVLLGISLAGVVGLAKSVSPAVESGVHTAGLPPSVVGVVIALLVLLPESLAAVRAALRDRVQTSLNLGLGSAMASIGLTIPAVSAASAWLPGPLLLGLDATHIVLLALTVAVGTLTVIPGRATPLQGGIHLAVLAAYLVLAVSP
ncbi:calcium:proton antiporter [Peterkaempfera griseoplana]|uniref:calcium:proton antiporter n=1 Tax=Peterkaempfera griseoplana TaxID=66896 RepID=UPI0006E444E1|nr:ionic transporter y4hA [Peterkaempfera griseoplana]